MKKKILIVYSEYYTEISSKLNLGASEYLKNNDVCKTEKEIIEIKYEFISTPGCFEIPFFINKYKETYDGFVALGCIIRGETYHFEIISNEVTRKLMDLNIELNKPVGFGILTCENIEQAKERSDPNKRNKGAEAAKACLDLLLLK